jgi:hypothetical protein
MQRKFSHDSNVVILHYIKNCLRKVSVASLPYLYWLERTENDHIDVVSTDTAFVQITWKLVRWLKGWNWVPFTNTHTHTHTHTKKKEKQTKGNFIHRHKMKVSKRFVWNVYKETNANTEMMLIFEAMCVRLTQTIQIHYLCTKFSTELKYNEVKTIL